jgi:hypothetical protein
MHEPAKDNFDAKSVKPKNSTGFDAYHWFCGNYSPLVGLS